MDPKIITEVIVYAVSLCLLYIGAFHLLFHRSDIFGGLYFNFVALIIYGIALYSLISLGANPIYVLSSVGYHLLLLVPFYLFIRKKIPPKSSNGFVDRFRNELRSFGFTIGEYKKNIISLSPIILFVIIKLIEPIYLGKEILIAPRCPVEVRGGYVFITLFLAPIIEEIYYRGLLSKYFEKKLREWEIIFLSSLLFAAIHIPKYLFVPSWFVAPVLELQFDVFSIAFYFFSMFMVGVYCSTIYFFTESIIYSILFHFLWNSISILAF